ncbi:polyamine aminopropyltransferase [Streptomyces sp. NPDC016845]|uniref:polyamine aminopropyltransferase n=1 Tax=Streptomyces sp. NPDC016845 TaxID=3364972 RepID=UPI0037BC3C7E
MIEPHVSAPPARRGVTTRPAGGRGRAPLPVKPGTGRFLVLVCVFVCAACGLVYELELVALASYLMGDSVTQASVVLSFMVFAMGLGSLAAKRLRPRAAAGFGLVEAALALVGGFSAMALYAVFAWTDGGAGAFGDSPRWLLVGFSLAIGVLIGAEVPLLMVLIQRIRRQDAGGAVADLFAADYVGALVGGLAFPFLLLPMFGQLTGALLTGAVNAVAGGALVLGLLRRDLSVRGRRVLLAVNLLVLGLLAAAFVRVDDFERAARQAIYGADVRVAVRTAVQEVVLTGGERGRPLDLYLDGQLRVSGRDEARRHAALVGPVMRGGAHARVLVLGGGDGLAVREVLRRPGVRHVDVLDTDAGVVRLARTDPGLRSLNRGALSDPRVEVRTGDVFSLLRGGGARGGRYDVVICDLPDPGRTDSTKLYSQEFYGLVSRVLSAPRGRVVVAGGAVSGRFWTVVSSVRAAGLRVVAYQHGPGPAAFVAAGRTAPRLPSVRPLQAPAHPRPPSTLVHPRYSD